MINSPQSLDTELATLLHHISIGCIQLPEFQRDWTWDDNRIRGIIASISQGYPMGAIMRLKYGNPEIKFKYRPITGTDETAQIPEYLILDGQQRLTSIFGATYSKNAIKTKNDVGKELERFYYLSIDECLDKDVDRFDAVYSIPKEKVLKKNAYNNIAIDLSTSDKEYENSMFPLNIVFDANAREDWADGYKDYYDNSKEVKEKYKEFRNQILDTISGYKLPVITLDKETPREAVCKVFENVNTGGVALTVFELVTAMFATHDFDLRADWNLRKSKFGVVMKS